ncbi:MAG: HNH endonuclease signature motif containing protein, partial [Candidatus Sericytochromatia bacterium]
VAASKSLAEVLRQLGLNDKAGGNYRYLWTKIRGYGLSTHHFTGQGWAKGSQKMFKPRQPDEEIFIANCPNVLNGPRLKRRLLQMGWTDCCHRCGISDWQGKPLTLHLDHINGINNDNRFENLRFLCPNCHQQTETWGNKKAQRRSAAPVDER